MKEKSFASPDSAPLLVVHVAPQRQHQQRALRWTCKAILGLLIFASLALFLTPTSVLPRDSDSIWSYLTGAYPFPHASWPGGYGLPYDQLQALLLETPSANKAREWSDYYTAGPHLAGKNLSQALWTRERWQEFGVEDTIIESYETYLNYPVDHRLALLKKTGDKSEVTFEASLEEDVLDEDRTSGLTDRVPVFHGYSANGNVTAPFVYVNHGTYHDFEDLVKANISLEGKIAIVKYGSVFRGLKVKRAQELGLVGIIMYDDPQSDGDITEADGYSAYPEGPARNPSAVQRGSVQFLSK